MKDKNFTAADLQQFTGTTEWYRHNLIKNVLYTEGVQFLAEKAGAYWLIDIVATMQTDARFKKQPFQAWKMKLLGHGANITVDDGNGEIFYSQNIEFTDFPLPEIELWAESDGEGRMVVLLPSEH